MLRCELCCSFRAVRLLCLILLQHNSLKTPFFSQMLCLGGVGAFLVSVRCAVLPTICLPRLRPAVVWFALLLQALLFCCGLCHGLRPAAESLCCSGLSQQRQAASAVGVYLSRGGLPR